MSIEDDPEKPREDDDAHATPEWHRARAKDLRRNGFAKMAEQHEQVAQTPLGKDGASDSYDPVLPARCIQEIVSSTRCSEVEISP